MAKDTVIARRYAKALFDLAVDRGAVERWQESLRIVLLVARREPALLDALMDSAHALAQRLRVIDDLLPLLGIDTDVGNFLKLLTERRRIASFSAIVDAYTQFVEERARVLTATVTTAMPLLDGDILAAIQRAVGELKQKQVKIVSHVDPELIGGVVIRIGDEVFDGSVAAELRKMRAQLLTTAL